MVGMRIMLVSALGEWSGMSDLHEAHDPERDPEIDTAGWLFSAIAIAIRRRYDCCLHGPRHDCECPCAGSSRRALGLGQYAAAGSSGSLAMFRRDPARLILRERLGRRSNGRSSNG